MLTPLDFLADLQRDGDHLPQVRGHRLDQRADGGDHHGRVARRVQFRVGQPAQSGQPASHGVGPG